MWGEGHRAQHYHPGRATEAARDGERKVASTNIDTMKLSNDMCSSEQLKDSRGTGRQREFMVARKGAKAVKPVKA